MVWRVILCLLVLGLVAAPALAQEATPTPDPTDPCAGRGPGTDADYVYCDCPPEGSSDADYAYGCVISAEAPREEEPTPAPEALPVSQVQPMAQALPRTGEDARVVALVGLAFLMTGSGLRLLLRSGGPRPSG